jgi:thiol-disulfide isomerase/thioredoxin
MVVRVRAPELSGAGGWLNTGGRPLGLAELRGKVVVLDFWTFCCVNCLHVLDELRELEDEFHEELVVIGVHSPKFVHETDHAAVAAAIERYEVAHPVLDDPELTMWRQYAVRAWPTLVVIDPDGYIVGQYSGEGHLHALQVLVRELVAKHEIRRGDNPYVPPVAQSRTLRFPSKTLVLPDGKVAVADSGHHRIVVFEKDAETIHVTIGDGERGLVDGPAHSARFSEPSGLCGLPPEISEQVGYDFVIADTVNHALRGFSSSTGVVSTIAGNGCQWMQMDPLPNGHPASTPMSSPWDVLWSDALQAVVVAMAGIHQIWTFDPITGTVSVLAGTTNEGLVDGPAERAWLAQTSGLAVDVDGTVWMVDSETSSLRRLRDGRLESVVGTGLFDFGLRDGEAAQALFQHPLGLCVLPDGSIAVADTYNGAVRRYDPSTGLVSTIATGLREPSDVDVVDGALLVTESAAHQLVRLPLDASISAPVFAFRTQRPPTSVRPGALRLDIAFTAPPGQKLDDRYGPSTHVVISSTPPELLVDGAYAGPELRHMLRIADGVESGVLHVAARAASCDVDAEFPACHVHQQDWGVPVTITADGTDELVLALGGSSA